jgi:cell fate regulator YaaT (PSP1 superfamily)
MGLQMKSSEYLQMREKYLQINGTYEGFDDNLKLLRNLASKFAARVEILEKFISENTKFDGKEVGKK